VSSALKQNVGDCLPSFATVALRVRSARYSSSEQKVLHPNLFRPELDVHGALPFAEVLVRLQHFPCGHWRVPECGPASGFLLPLCLPPSADDLARPLFQRGFQSVQDGGLRCLWSWWTSLPPSRGLLRRSIGRLVTVDSLVRRDPSYLYVEALFSEGLESLRDDLEQIGPGCASRLGR
jgi:hypothetical protein